MSSAPSASHPCHPWSPQPKDFLGLSGVASSEDLEATGAGDWKLRLAGAKPGSSLSPIRAEWERKALLRREVQVRVWMCRSACPPVAGRTPRMRPPLGSSCSSPCSWAEPPPPPPPSSRAFDYSALKVCAPRSAPWMRPWAHRTAVRGGGVGRGTVLVPHWSAPLPGILFASSV